MRKAVRGRKRLAAPARKLARRVSVMELTGQPVSKMIFPSPELLWKEKSGGTSLRKQRRGKKKLR